ncbi:MAG TPA: type II toxin-antitoxin system VapC family toxin [Terracidiphilus sp.]|nr:type II toxin-antitoxin system VapC family toxin [Terracidiphilus sp.]
MRILLDTHALIWLMEANPRLNDNASVLITDADEVCVSSASIWEVAIKARLGKIKTDPRELFELAQRAGLKELQVSARHAIVTRSLPLVHPDPFDRLLVAQAISEPMHLLTADAKLAEYSELVIVI